MSLMTQDQYLEKREKLTREFNDELSASDREAENNGWGGNRLTGAARNPNNDSRFYDLDRSYNKQEDEIKWKTTMVPVRAHPNSQEIEYVEQKTPRTEDEQQAKRAEIAARGRTQVSSDEATGMAGLEQGIMGFFASIMKALTNFFSDPKSMNEFVKNGGSLNIRHGKEEYVGDQLVSRELNDINLNGNNQSSGTTTNATGGNTSIPWEERDGRIFNQLAGMIPGLKELGLTFDSDGDGIITKADEKMARAVVKVLPGETVNSQTINSLYDRAVQSGVEDAITVLGRMSEVLKEHPNLTVTIPKEVPNSELGSFSPNNARAANDPKEEKTEVRSL